MSRWLADPAAQVDRTWFSSPHPEERRIRDTFRRNVRSILSRAAEFGVPVVLTTLPVNLMYDGLERELVLAAEEEKLRPCLEQGVAPFEAGRFDDAISRLRACLGLPEARRWIAMAELQAEGRTDLGADLESVWGPCVQAGVEQLYADRPREAISLLEQCDEAEESLRWIGLARAALGEWLEARRALEASTSLLPRNRCRPIFNQDIRDIAREYPRTSLVDLDEGAVRASLPGLPGRNLFVDSCHMNWRGYAEMARLIAGGLDGLEVPGLPRIEERWSGDFVQSTATAAGLVGADQNP